MGTILITAVSVCLGFALKSKCSSVRLCGGCIEIIRDIDAEVELEEENINQNVDDLQIPPIPPILPSNTSISNKNPSVRRVSIKNSRTLQQLIDIIKPTEPINNNVDPSVINYPTLSLEEIKENNIEYKL